MSATVTRLNVQVKASVMYLLCTDGEKKEIFSFLKYRNDCCVVFSRKGFCFQKPRDFAGPRM